MSKTVSIDDMTDVIVQELSQYTSEICEGIKQDAQDVAKTLAANIKADSPKDTKKYSAGWKVTVAQESATSISAVVHNAKKPGLTHLLENGHAMRGGGRSPAFPHIKKNEEKALEEFPERAEERIQNGH